MITEPFPQVSSWADEHLPDHRKEEFREYRYAVDYHLGHSTEAGRECSLALWRFDWTLNAKQKLAVVDGLSPDAMVRYGDTAIREAISALDTGLLLVNHALGLRVRQRRVRWPQGPLRQALQRLPEDRGGDLIAAIDSVFGSIGYELLRGYRDWVTHRGAPSILLEPGLPRLVPVPDEVHKIADPDEKEWRIRTHLLTTVPAQIRVRCWPFYPPVQLRYSATIDEAKTDIDLPGGIHIGKGAKGIEIRDTRVVAGDLSENAEAFKSKNPILVEEHRAKVAGEDLAVYTAMDYVQAVSAVVRFVEQTLAGEWDTQLSRLYEAR